MNGLLTDDERLIVGAARRLGLILSSDWPDVAAHLLAQGADGKGVSELAGLPRAASPWLVDQLVPNVLAELGIQEMPVKEAGDLVARFVGQVARVRPEGDEFAAIRFLARLAPDLDYPGGFIGDAYYASEWLDCACHGNSPERDAAIALESALRTTDPLDIDAGLLQAVTTTWF
ncbi:hypothetical protein [Paractinoplanes toevensis]|uniref:Uncharacterized protein n=1 Tax=Paractinoplanes toevensis TaxID=571911 RepID=A0A919W9I5_9ACTN|nr:hypothetical protein [Actinoplanes toevensis]GIM96099.1 hypothetical protein Ato02nite_078920 [Actinoplanes toevensis]